MAIIIELDNYRPRADSPLVAEGRQIGALSAVVPEPPIEPPTDPEPPGEWVALPRIDYDEAIAALRESRAAIDAALKLLDEDIKEF